MTKHTAARLLSILFVLAAVSSTRAAFQVKRAMHPDAIAAAPPLATIVRSPFDDTASSLVDGTSYYYAVVDGAGKPLTIAVMLNPAAGCLRVSFDDGIPNSAPTSAALSSVSVSPASIRADGLQTAVGLIVPLDASGVLLGRGLSVSVDASLLWPGKLLGGVDDLGDGTYRVRVVSDVPGSGMLAVAVEGIPLVTAPALTYTAADPNGSLRDLAILQLRDLTAPGGRFDALVGSAGARTPQAADAQQAWNGAAQAASDLANGDLLRDDNTLKTGLDAVLGQLAALANDPGTTNRADVIDLMNDLLDVARLVALYHLDLASQDCGACVGGSPFKVCNAAAFLNQADADRTAVNPDWSSIVDEYARSVEWSLQSEHAC